MDQNTEKLLLNSTSFIRTVDRHGRRRTATCFFVKTIKNNKEISYLVTNKHVLNDKRKIYLYLNYYDTEKNLYTYNNEISITLGSDVHYHMKYDLAVLNLSFLDKLNTNTRRVSYTTIGLGMIPSDFSICSNLQSIIMLGYPSGIYNENFNLPIVRSGITATPINNSYKNKDEFIVDIPSLGGSSGSPILAEIDDKLYLVGIIYSTLQQKVIVDKFKNRMYHKSQYTIKFDGHLGVAIRSNQISDFIDSISRE